MTGFCQRLAEWKSPPHSAKTPRPVVMKLNAAFKKVMSDPAIGKRLSESGFELQTSTPEEFAAYMKSEIAKWRKQQARERTEKNRPDLLG